ncbi:altered inheritance of mitochondria protein 21 [Bisporella sp. PMI_857]|nr:altered inheritance of mitochondria protein 21 [Bisporella sp. PMI_857]
MSTSMPQVPPRPVRAQAQGHTGSGTLGSDLPKIPPRPIRRINRSPSPNRESYARSPLNEMPPHFSNQASQNNSSLYTNGSANTSSTELPPRPSSVVLPSIGQEGSEYADVFSASEELSASPTNTRNIAGDLKLHAPKPSLPISSAKRRVSTVTRTDSDQAAAFGIGRAHSDDAHPSSGSLKKKGSVSSTVSHGSNGTERPPSSLDSEHGIPEIGQRVPMYPNAGDVQAPSPGIFSTPFAPGIRFHNDGSKPRHHGRRTSARGSEIPFDAYGKHGHGQTPKDHFEKAYYEKHPELYKKETGHYHGPFAEERPEWAMSSEDLNKIVRDTASRGVGLGTSPAIIGTPSEQIGFQASEEYTSRMSSPRPQSGVYHVQHSNASFSSHHADSPLRESFEAGISEKEEFEGQLAKSLRVPSETALESEAEGDDTIHVDPRARRIGNIYGAAGNLESTESLGFHTEEDTFRDEHGYSAPILASDEVAKEPFGYELQPAVSPLNERRSGYEEGFFHGRTGSSTSQNGSRPSSRPASIHGAVPVFQGSNSTPLEDLEEYEPLFPEDGKSGQAATTKKPLTAADKLKRPELKNRKFPSQDIWEDTPNSLQYTAEVSTPQLPEEEEGEVRRVKQARENETPAEAFARRQEELAEKESLDSESFLNREKKPWAHASQVVADTRPNLKQRFPSRDIWEDTPDSLQLETTVSGPQSEDQEAFSPHVERPTTGAVAYHHEKAAAGIPLGADEGRATTGLAAVLKPQVPARPARSKPSAESSPVEQRQPAIPERPKPKHAEDVAPPIPLKTKPVVPARPPKPITRESSENVPLTTIQSNSSTKSAGSDSSPTVVAKPKPAVPSRPVGSKIAALQGGFMSDLNKRLKLGPQAPKKEEVVEEQPEVEKEKVPLVDARKGRARGPARRAPAKSPAPVAEAVPEQKANSFTFVLCTPSTVWQIDPEEDALQVGSEGKESTPALEPVSETKAAESETPTLATNTAGESIHEASEMAANIKLPSPVTTEEADEETAEPEESRKDVVSIDIEKDQAEPLKPSDSAPVKTGSTSDPATPEEVGTEGLSASTATLKAEPTEVEKS